MLKVYDKNKNKIQLAEAPKIIVEKAHIPITNEVRNELIGNTKMLFITFIFEGNWYFSKTIRVGYNGTIIVIPELNYKIYLMVYDGYFKISNPNNYDLSKFFIIEVLGIS